MIIACAIVGGGVAGLLLFTATAWVVLMYGPDTSISF